MYPISCANTSYNYSIHIYIMYILLSLEGLLYMVKASDPLGGHPHVFGRFPHIKHFLG